jgi:N-acetylmuramoyl-L-alanine amidase
MRFHGNPGNKNNKMALVLMLVSVFCWLTPGTALAELVRVQGNRVNIRQAPTTESASLGVVDSGVTFTVKSRENNWTQVELANGTGWIRDDLLQTMAQLEVKGQNVRVRKGPGTNYDIVGMVNRGEKYTALGTQNGWYKIDWPQEGWISGDYAAVISEEPVLPVMAAADVPSVSVPVEPVAANPAETPNVWAETSAGGTAADSGGGGSQGTSGTVSAEGESVTQDVLAVPLGGGVSFSVVDQGGRPELMIKGVDRPRIRMEIPASSMGKSLSIVIDGAYERQYETGLDRIGLTRIALTGTGGALTISVDAIFSIAIKEQYDAATKVLRLGLTDQVIRTQSVVVADAANPPRSDPQGLIVIDPGHGGFTSGGFDPGALGYKTRLQERVVVLDISMQMKTLLEAEGYRVIMTHTGSTTLDLAGRANVANNAGADIFVSIHANASVRHDYGGHTTYFYAPADKPELFAQRRLRNMLAADIQGEMVKAGGRPDLGVLEANFAVLRATQMPSVLVETAFLSHPEEEQLLGTADYRRRLAEGIVKGINLYFQKVK